MLDKLGEITDLYMASKMRDVGFQPHLNGIYEVGYHCQRRVHHCYADEILTVLRALGESATDATFMQALGIEGYDKRFTALAKVQSALGVMPIISQLEEIRAVFAGLDVEVTTHDKAIVLRRSGCVEVLVNELNAVDFFVVFLPSALVYHELDIFDYNKVAHKDYVTRKQTLDFK